MDRFEKFTSSILKLNRFVQKIKAFEMKEYNLKGTSIMCLYYLNIHNGLTSSELVKLCEEDKAAISRAIATLYEKGYILYIDNEIKKKYNTKIYLSNEGKIVADNVHKKVNRVLEKGGNGLTDEQRNCFYDSLSIIMNNLEEYTNECEG